MSKKQTLLFNLLILFLLISFLGFSQTEKEHLLRADSLFQNKKYTESFEIYEQIFNNENKATPQMLLKMAFIKEGLGDHSQALVYLNKYYLNTSDRMARSKMQEIADENDLIGYDRSDTTFFIGLINRHFAVFVGALLVLAGLLMAIVIFRKVKKQGNVLPYAIGSIITLISLAAILNLELAKKQVIISDNHAYIMSGPSSGSDLIDVVKKGHRVDLIDENDIWIKIDWQGQEAYIRKSKVLRAG